MAKRPARAATPPPAEPAGQVDLSHIAEGLRPLAVALDSLQLDPKNARKHSPENIASIEASLRKFGQMRAAVVNRSTGVILVGNGMTIAARNLGWTHLAVLYGDFDPATATGYAIADNRTAELAEWDDARLAEAIAEIEETDPDLAAALLLDDLLQQESAADVPEIEPQTNLAVLIEHLPSEAEQRRLFDSLVAQGLKVKVLTT